MNLTTVRRSRLKVDDPMSVVFVVAALIGVAVFAALLIGDYTAAAVSHTGTVVSVSSESYQYQCGSVGGDASKGDSGTPLWCTGTDYPSVLTVAGEQHQVTLPSQPQVGAQVTVWHVDNSSWTAVNPHSWGQVLLDLVAGAVAAVIAALIGLFVLMALNLD